MDLRDKLRQFEKDLAPRQPNTVRSSHLDVDVCVEGKVVKNAKGTCFQTSSLFSATHQHGRIPFNLLHDSDPSIFPLVARDEALTGVDLRDAVFVDTETTGLAGGAGTVPFMIGMGYFEGDDFRVDQIFMRDFHEEPAALDVVADRLARAKALVSYNGKAYDLPLLASRFTLARMPNPASKLPHLDLLFAVRRIWRKRLADCSLSTVEEGVLDFRREDDVPGWAIPGLYFDYLRSRNGCAIAPVFKHNKWDIVTLAALAGLMGRVYASPFDHLTHPFDLMGLGRAMAHLGRLDAAARCYRLALNGSLPAEEKEEALQFYGLVLKRMGDWDRAVKVWDHMIQSVSQKIHPCEELAKYYEHQIRRHDLAIEVVRFALDWIDRMEQLRPTLVFTAKRKDLAYRLARLERKMGKVRRSRDV